MLLGWILTAVIAYLLYRLGMNDYGKLLALSGAIAVPFLSFEFSHFVRSNKNNSVSENSIKITKMRRHVIRFFVMLPIIVGSLIITDMFYKFLPTLIFIIILSWGYYIYDVLLKKQPE